jgi:hypothetical protein
LANKTSKKRDDSYFAAGRRRNRKYMMIIIPIVAALVAIGIAAAVMSQRPTGDFGPLGSAHEHAVFEVRIDGDPIDFSQPRYQVRSQYLHVENGDGTTLHRHSTHVPIGEFFRSVGMSVETDCFVSDNGSRFCEDETNQLRYFVNGAERSSITDYILEENDRILIIYGNESEQEIQEAIADLNDVVIQG